MDKNTTTGMFLIAAIMLGWSYFFAPQQVEKPQQDIVDTVAYQASTVNETNTNHKVEVSKTEEFITLQNSVLKVTLTTKGARIYSVQLNNEKNQVDSAVQLFNGKDNKFGLVIPVEQKNIHTNNEMFSVVSNENNTVVLRYSLDNDRHVDFTYALNDSYLVDYKISLTGIDKSILNSKSDKLDLEWVTDLQVQEKDKKSEQQYSTIYYRTKDEAIDYISETKDETYNVEENIQWVSFKQHFFSSVLISEAGELSNAALTTKTYLNNGSDLKQMTMEASLPIQSHYNLKFFFGPNLYKTLETSGYDLQEQIGLGWGPLGWVNRWAVIPLFSLFESMGMNYGLIIIVLTLTLKIVLLPLTYKSYISQAKMRILKPELDEIKEKVGEDNQARLQQENMKLYREAGVNPLAGCVPLLLQLPILLAFFKFFPASYELRQKSFLWVEDLSTFDAFISFPFEIPFLGSHLSLMCVLMTVSTLIYTWQNNRISGVTGQMKVIGYVMPVVFLGMLNSFPAGLNFYYFCSNIVTFIQQMLIQKFVDEDAIHAKIQENKKRPEASKKSKWQERMEQFAKQQQQESNKNK